MSDEQNGDNQKILKNLLNRSCGADGETELADYFSGIKRFHKECEFLPPRNPRLEQFWSDNPDINSVIDLTYSGTHLKGHKPAFDAAEKAREIKEKGSALTSMKNQLADLGDSQIAQIPTQALFDGFDMAVKSLPLETCKKIAASSNVHPAIMQFLDDVGQEKKGLYIDANEEEAVKKSLVSTIIKLCEYEIDGKHKPDGDEQIPLRKKMKQIVSQIEAEEERLKDRKALYKHGHEINKSELRPAIATIMQNLHGMQIERIKQNNICVCDGSSSAIMDAVLESILPKKKSFMDMGRKQKILMFSACWDGLKAHAAGTGKEVGIVGGG